jgi:hypothetical protein
MDLHRKRSQVALLDHDGTQLLNRNLPNDPAELVPILGQLEPGTPVAFEAAYGWAGWRSCSASSTLNRSWSRPARRVQILDPACELRVRSDARVATVAPLLELPLRRPSRCCHDSPT